MSARRCRGLAALPLTVVLVVLATMTSRAGAANTSPVTVTEVGWWSNVPGAAAQPERGFQITNAGPLGPQSVAAFRVKVSDTVTSATLAVIQSDGIPPTGTLQVCPTTAPWTAANPGPWGEAPVADCSVTVALTAGTAALPGDPITWTGDVLPLFSSATPGSEVSLMIVPGPATGNLPFAPPFHMTFAGGGLVATGSASPTTAPPASTPAPPVTTPTAGGIVPSFTVPVPSGLFTPAGPSTPAAPATTVAPPPTTLQSAGSIQPLPDAPRKAKPWGRLLVYVPVCAAIGMAGAFGRRYLETRGTLAH